MSGFGTIQPRNINEIVASIEKQIRDIKADFGRDYTVLSNKLEKCEFDLKKLKEYIEEVHDYTESEYNRLQEQISQFEGQIAELKDNLSYVNYTRSGQETVAVGIAPLKEYSSTSSTYPFSAKYAVNDSNGNNIVETYATKQELSSTSATLSGDYVQKIADSSSAGMSALSSVSGELVEHIENEAQERSEADIIMNNAIVSETSRALQSESNLDTKIDNEISRSTNKDTVLEQKITTEQNRAESAESNLQEALSTETTRASTAENTLQSNIDSEIERATGIEAGLRTDLDNEISRATETETTIQTTLQENIDNEVTRATNAENTLQSNIDSEATLRESTDNTIQTNLSNEITRATGVEEGLRTDLTAEITRATGVENTLTTNLNDEISNRETADRDLQAQIDTIEATQNIVDIVGSYAELEVYDTTHLKNNDKIQVLQDEIQGGSTIYTWNKDESKWDFIGEFGPYYTTYETDDLLNTKQNNLSAGDGIDITNDVVSHSIKIIENNNTEDIVEGTVFTVYLKNNHYKIITFDKTITEIKFMIEQSTEGILQETGFEFAIPEDSDLETLSFEVIDLPAKKIYTIIPDSYTPPNIYQGTIVNYRCTIGEYEVED
jgi:hypothetical protein